MNAKNSKEKNLSDHKDLLEKQSKQGLGFASQVVETKPEENPPLPEGMPEITPDELRSILNAGPKPDLPKLIPGFPVHLHLGEESREKYKAELNGAEFIYAVVTQPIAHTGMANLCAFTTMKGDLPRFFSVPHKDSVNYIQGSDYFIHIQY